MLESGFYPSSHIIKVAPGVSGLHSAYGEEQIGVNDPGSPAEYAEQKGLGLAALPRFEFMAIF